MGKWNGHWSFARHLRQLSPISAADGRAIPTDADDLRLYHRGWPSLGDRNLCRSAKADRIGAQQTGLRGRRLCLTANPNTCSAWTWEGPKSTLVFSIFLSNASALHDSAPSRKGARMK